MPQKCLRHEFLCHSNVAIIKSLPLRFRDPFEKSLCNFEFGKINKCDNIKEQDDTKQFIVHTTVEHDFKLSTPMTPLQTQN